MKFRNDLILRRVGNEFLIVEPGNDAVDLSMVYSLNSSAAFIWTSLQGKDFDQDTIAELLISEYGISPRSAFIDGEKILMQFLSQKLVVID